MSTYARITLTGHGVDDPSHEREFYGPNIEPPLENPILRRTRHFFAITFGAFVKRRSHLTPFVKFQAQTSEMILLRPSVPTLQQKIQGDPYLAYSTYH